VITGEYYLTAFQREADVSGMDAVTLSFSDDVPRVDITPVLPDGVADTLKREIFGQPYATSWRISSIETDLAAIGMLGIEIHLTRLISPWGPVAPGKTVLVGRLGAPSVLIQHVLRSAGFAHQKLSTIAAPNMWLLRRKLPSLMTSKTGRAA
jgi:hypothetical protein